MTNPTEDPFASSAGDDGLSDAQTEFIKAKHFRDRFIIVEPREHLKGLKGEHKDYDALMCDIHVLNGPTSEVFPRIPMIMESIRLSGESLVPSLLPKLSRAPGVKAAMGTMKGFISQRRSNATEGFILEPPQSDEQRAAARKYWAAYRERLAAQTRAADTADPFAV